MSYKMESIKKVLKLARETEYKLNQEKIDEIKMCISNGNKKIGRVMNVSLMPVMTCANCSECMFLCYDIKACLQYPGTVIDARMRNTVIWKKDPEKYFGEIRKKLSRRRKNFFFRWHVAGDIPNSDYFAEMVKIANEFSHFIFWTYTKNYKVVNNYVKENGRDSIPENLHIMFSEWDGMPLDNPYNFPVFACKLKAGNKNHSADYFNSLHKCPGNCDICKKTGRGCIAGETTYCDEH